MQGFLVVASRYYAYYEAAHGLIDSILDNYPEANIALFAHKEWTGGDSRCDDLYLVHDVPNHSRAKLWALPKTPFETTVYLDVDTYVCHEDVKDMFDLNGNDLMFSNIRPYAGKIAKFDGGEMILNGGVFTYNNTQNTLQFMQDWFDYYDKQINNKWWPEGIGPKEKLYGWDQFTLWWLLQGPYKDSIKLGIYNDDARFNFVRVYRDDECEGEIVVWHYTIPEMELMHNERNIN